MNSSRILNKTNKFRVMESDNTTQHHPSQQQLELHMPQRKDSDTVLMLEESSSSQHLTVISTGSQIGLDIDDDGDDVSSFHKEEAQITKFSPEEISYKPCKQQKQNQQGDKNKYAAKTNESASNDDDENHLHRHAKDDEQDDLPEVMKIPPHAAVAGRRESSSSTSSFDATGFDLGTCIVNLKDQCSLGDCSPSKRRGSNTTGRSSDDPPTYPTHPSTTRCEDDDDDDEAEERTTYREEDDHEEIEIALRPCPTRTKNNNGKGGSSSGSGDSSRRDRARRRSSSSRSTPGCITTTTQQRPKTPSISNSTCSNMSSPHEHQQPYYAQQAISNILAKGTTNTINVAHINGSATASQDGNSAARTDSSQSSIYFLTEERVRAFMVDYYDDFNSIGQSSECLETFFNHYCIPQIRWMRPSGNPINYSGLIHLFTEDLQIENYLLVSVDSIQIVAGGLAAIVTVTADQIFTYRGIPNSDRAVISSVLEVVNNGREIKIVHEHRTTGRPIPKETRWSTTES